jgi:serine protease DegQ
MQRSLLAAAALAVLLGLTDIACAADAVRPPGSETPGQPDPIGASRPVARPPSGYRSAVARVSPSVVTVYSVHTVKPVKSTRSVTVAGLGSGVVIDASGDIVTNYHVIEDASDLAVALVDGRVVPCRVVGSDPESDLALLHIDVADLQPIAFADIDDVQPGDIVLAVGNPLGLGQAVSQGIVSAVARRGVRPTENFIQTDAAINPGNSGGALVDTSGRLVGINVMILSHSGGSEGVGLAIPVDLVQTVVASLRAHGRVARGWLGWSAEATPEGDGAIVVAIERNGPAQRAGIVPGDVVTRVGTRSVHRTLDAASVIVGSDPGTHVPVEIVRRGVPATLDVELAPLPASHSGAEKTSLRSR